MLENIFLTVVKMSITASIAAIIVILLRKLAGKKLPVTFSYAAWVIVLVRLLVPFSVQSDFSIFNFIKFPETARDGALWASGPWDKSASQYSADAVDLGRGNSIGIIDEAKSTADGNIYISNSVMNDGPEENIHTDKAGVSGEKGPVTVMACIWMSVFLVLLAFCTYAHLKIIRSFKTAVLFNDNGLLAESAGRLDLRRKVSIYISDKTDTPVVYGIANARIIIPALFAGDRYGKELEYVIAHELVHIKRYDNITRLLAVLALCIHWFNPLMWLCFLLYQKDMEMSCDARVLSAYENDIRSEYANTLLNIAVKQNTLLRGVVPAFGESNIKSRIKGIMKFRKNKAWAGIFAALLLVVLAFVLLTNGKNDYIAEIRSAMTRNNIISDLLEHRSRYIGNASNAGNLLNKLPYAGNKEGIKLDTGSKPYGITVNYRLDDIDAVNEDKLKNAKPVLLDNALILFSLIENVDIVRFNILPSNTIVQFERAQLQQYFDRELWEYSNSKEDFERFLQDIYFEIYINPGKYSPDMSSVPGMGISITLNKEFYNIAHSIKFSTENGSLLLKDAETGQITDHGKMLDVTLASLEQVYWSPADMDESVQDNIITISVLKKNGDIIKSKSIRIGKEDSSSFTVVPSYDITADVFPRTGGF